MTWNLDEILKYSRGDIVAVQPVNAQNAMVYADARSAAFYALGKALKTCGTVTLVVPGQYLSSTYTAITEAWFQKANVVVLALFEKVSEVKTSWMDRCVLHTASYGPDEQMEFGLAMKKAVSMSGPVLFNLVGVSERETNIDYAGVLAALRAVTKSVTAWVYNPEIHEDAYLRTINAADTYGVISRYIGMSTAMDAGVLICPARCALLDMNIFRTRYANGNMKIILLDEGGILDTLDIEKWISGNGWEYRSSKVADITAYKWLMDQKRQAVLFIK